MVVVLKSRNDLLPEISKITLANRYSLPGESPQKNFARVAKAFASTEEHAQRLYNYASKLWFMFASPLLSNGGTEKGSPISCFLNYVGDSREDLVDHYAENVWLSTGGGGIGGCFDAVRSIGQKTSKGSATTGIIPFIHMVDAQMLAFQQGTNRRGKYSANLHVSHPEIEEFIGIIAKKGGDINRKAMHSFNCVTIPNAFMEAVRDDKMWPLIDPHSRVVVKQVRAFDLWVKILTARMQEGAPYIHFVDHSKQAMPLFQKHLGLTVNQTNLCSEITLPTNIDRTAVCCLSSVNLEKYDEWKADPYFIHDLIEMLDNTLTVFIEANEKNHQMRKAVYSASRERAVGLGAMGFHSYLQKNNIPFEGPIAKGININMFRHIKERARAATYALAHSRGPCPDYQDAYDKLRASGLQDERAKYYVGHPVRNACLMAIAPNATSSIICGNTSPSIEPLYSNYYTQRTQNGVFTRKNTFLQAKLQELKQDTDAVWDSIKFNKGSVQHLDFLDDWSKKVYKTAFEIDQEWIIEHAANRQEYICQSQSLNLFLPPDVNKATLHNIHWQAWEKKVKTLYYMRSRSLKTADKIAHKIKREIREEHVEPDEPPASGCLGCEG